MSVSAEAHCPLFPELPLPTMFNPKHVYHSLPWSQTPPLPTMQPSRGSQ